MNRRQILALATFVTPLIAVAAACSFPDVTFGPGSGGQEGGTQEGGGSEPSNDSGNLPDAMDLGDVAVRDEASARVDASGCDATCDCDKDGYFKTGCDAGEDAAGKKGGGDCDDLDPLRHPNAPFTAAEPVGHDGDWDCNTKVDTQPTRNITCGGNGTLGCSGGPGFIDEPKCGTKGDFFTCERQANILNPCVAKPSGNSTTVYCK